MIAAGDRIIIAGFPYVYVKRTVIDADGESVEYLVAVHDVTAKHSVV